MQGKSVAGLKGPSRGQCKNCSEIYENTIIPLHCREAEREVGGTWWKRQPNCSPITVM